MLTTKLAQLTWIQIRAHSVIHVYRHQNKIHGFHAHLSYRQHRHQHVHSHRILVVWTARDEDMQSSVSKDGLCRLVILSNHSCSYLDCATQDLSETKLVLCYNLQCRIANTEGRDHALEQL